MNQLYEYKTKGKNTCLHTVCNVWNMAYNLSNRQMKYNIPESTGSGSLESVCINKDIRMINYNVNFCTQIEMQGISKKPHLDILFCLGESIDWELPESKKEFQLFTKESYIGISKETEKHCIFPAKHDMHILEIKIPLYVIKDILEETCISCDYDDFTTKQIAEEKYPLSPSVQVVLHQLLHPPYHAGLNQLYTEAKILELLTIYLSETMLRTDKQVFLQYLSSDDIQCLYHAKEILDANLANPPTIRLLSKIIGLNEYKLKKGFKELFSIPVHAYVIQKKLELAKLLLDGNDISISETASCVGYGNASHFSAAFRKQYGINPRDYLRNIKIKSNVK